MGGPSQARVVWLVAHREVRARLRARSFLLGTAAAVAVLIGLVLLQGALLDRSERVRVGLAGQASAIAGPLVERTAAKGLRVEPVVTDLARGSTMVADGELDALVSGAPAALRATVRDAIDEDLRKVLDALVQEQVLRAQLAAVEDLDADEVLATVAGATVDVRALGGPDPRRGQRLAVALFVVALLYLALLHGAVLAKGVVEEKSSHVVEVLLPVVRPWQLLLGKILGLGLVGLARFAAICLAALVAASAAGVLPPGGTAAGALLWGLVWYLLGHLFYAAVFGAAGALVSRREETPAVLLPLTLALGLAFALGFGLLARAPSAPVTAVLSLVPPLSPVIMPGRIALGAAPGWQVALALLLTSAAIAAAVAVGGRAYARAALHDGPRMSLREAIGRRSMH